MSRFNGSFNLSSPTLRAVIALMSDAQLQFYAKALKAARHPAHTLVLHEMGERVAKQVRREANAANQLSHFRG